MKNSILIISLVFCVQFINANANDSEKEQYFQFGITERTFNNSDLNDVGTMWGLESSYGIEVQNNLTATIFGSFHYVEISSDERLRYQELAVWFDYRPAGFYLGVSPTFTIVTVLTRRENQMGGEVWDTYSKNALGFSGRIGYRVQIKDDIGVYFEAKYSKVKIESDSGDLEIGTAGFSAGLSFRL